MLVEDPQTEDNLGPITETIIKSDKEFHLIGLKLLETNFLLLLFPLLFLSYFLFIRTRHIGKRQRRTTMIPIDGFSFYLRQGLVAFAILLPQSHFISRIIISLVGFLVISFFLPFISSHFFRYIE